MTSRRWRLEGIVGATRHDELGELGREEALEAAELLELADLVLDAALERPVPLGALLGEVLHGVVEVLDPEHGLDPGHQRRLIHGLRQVLVAPGFEAGDDVRGIRLGRHEDDRDEGKRRIRPEPPADLEPVQLGHHHVEQDEIGLCLLRRGERLLAVGRGDDVVPAGGQAHLQDVDVRRRVVHDQDPRRCSHAEPSGSTARYARILARSSRGTKGFVT